MLRWWWVSPTESDRRFKDFLASSADTFPQNSVVSQFWYLIENVELVFCHSLPQEEMWWSIYLHPRRRNQNRFCIISNLTLPYRSMEWRWFYESANSKKAILQIVKCSLWSKHAHVALDITGMSYFSLETVFTQRVLRKIC